MYPTRKVLVFFNFFLNSIILNVLSDSISSVENIITEFPKKFKFGAATAAYQIEGGWNEDGKEPNIWDTFTHEHPELIADHSNGNVAANSYHYFDKDLKVIKELGIDFYRFSISWSRILPAGDPSIINQAGINYYNNIINRLIENKITPMVTMHHFDLPQILEDNGGFMNPDILTYFEKYADILFKNFGDRVKFWYTINEPFMVCRLGYSNGMWAPGIHSEGLGEYSCFEHTLKSHALAYRLYRRNYFDKFNGKIGIALNSGFQFSNDTQLVERGLQFEVKVWFTFNEPFYVCRKGYGNGQWAPGIKSDGLGEYFCLDHILKAHALAYRTYYKNYYDRFEGKIGLTLNTRYYLSNDTELVNRALQFTLGLLANPIYSELGGYPDVVIKDIARNSLREGRPVSRLPQLDDAWKKLIQGSADFFGLNYYTSRIVVSNKSAGNSPSWARDAEIELTIDPKWKRGQSKHLYSVPEGLENILKWIRDHYGNIEIIIGENGWSDKEKTEDDERITYFKDHLQAVLNAINDECNVIAYTAWSLIDNFEWSQGYTEQFGLYSVDFSSPEKTRTAKKSSKYYNYVIRTRRLEGFTSSSQHFQPTFSNIVLFTSLFVFSSIYLKFNFV